MSSMKRMRENREVEALAMANCLMLLSRVGATAAAASTCGGGGGGRVFTCKTCHREFSSFQALGGHRASHKKPRLGEDLRVESPAATKPKSHECSICGVEFAIGQALGGHMRRHRLNNALSTTHSSDKSSSDDSKSVEPVPVLKKSNSSGGGRGKRVSLCLDLDLNLTPRENHINKIDNLSSTSFSSWLIA